MLGAIVTLRYLISAINKISVAERISLILNKIFVSFQD
jgi:hypothetical protein